MSNKNGFTIVEILVVIVILAVVGLIIMMSVIPQIEQNAKDSFINDIKLYLQASSKVVTDAKIDGEDITTKCVSISDLNKTDVGVIDKKNYSGYVEAILDSNDNSITYNFAITNNHFYTYNRANETYAIDSGKLNNNSILDNYNEIKDFPNKCK